MEDRCGRRSFMKKTSVTAAALGLGMAGASRAYAANEKIRAAVIGLRGRGGSHIGGFGGLDGVEVVALCDVDESQNGKRADQVEKKTGKRPKTYVDLRELYDNRNIDVVGIATPNHWHTLAGIWAMQSGKHCYIEKPCSHNVSEGRNLLGAARTYNKICQHGTQIRSSVAIREAIQFLRDGIIGEVYMAKGLCYKWRNTIGKKPESTPPPGVHYDRWLGPAPTRPFTQNRFHYNWHWHWDYGNGDIGNQGVHQMDVARWGLGVGLPRKVQAMGGHYMFDDDQETPNTMVSTMEYPDEKKMLVFEVRHWVTNNENVGRTGSNAVGNIFYGSEGIMVMPSYTSYKVFLGRKHEEGPARSAGGDHFANFIDAVRAGDHTKLHADIEGGHLSSAACHLANVAYRLGRTIEFDPETEQCIGDAEANAMMTRNYRAPFVVPSVS